MKKAKLLYGGLAMVVMAWFVITGCGGGGATGTADTTQQDGQLAVSLTDAPGDFANYTVDVLSLTLTKANGAEVSTLPTQTRIDFSQYTDMAEFLTVASVPSGTYVAASMTLDYSNADIWVENPSGEQVKVGTILDSDGNPVTSMAMTVRLDDRSRLVIAPGVPAHLQVDFNLEATNQVSFDEDGTPTLTVDPFLVADVNRTDSKLHRLRGLLDSVSVDESSFSVYLRPFFCPLASVQNSFGARTVLTTAATLFDINGDQYVGQDGLTALAALTPLSAVVAIGDLKFNPLRFEARQVYAGSSVPGGTLDVVEGNVVSRRDDTLTVRGATLIRTDGTVLFHDLVTVQVGPDTAVSRQFSTDTLDKDDISVGQRVAFAGQLSDTDPMALTLDATAGYARLKITTVRGTVVGVDAGNATAQLTVDAQSISLRPVENYDFTGTGIDAAHDADPGNYEINTGTLDLGTLAGDAPVKVRGFVQPFGQAPADFNAQSIIGVADVRAFMKVQWMPPSDGVFSGISTDGLVLNLDPVGAFHYLVRGWVVTDLTDAVQAPAVVPRADGTGLFVIRYHGAVQVVLTFDDFIDALQGYLDDGAAVHNLGAVGAYDDATAALTADMVDIQLK
jgi:Domain of unknown function (DUF4382)